MAKMGRPRKETAKRKSVTIRMSEDTHKRLTEYAVQHQLSITEVTLQGLEEYLSKSGACCESSIHHHEGGDGHGKGTEG